MIELLLDKNIQGLIAVFVLLAIICYRYGYIEGQHEGYQQGMQDLYNTITMNDFGRVKWRPED